MLISQRKENGKRVIEVSGALTVAGSRTLKKAIQENLRKGCRLELVIGETSEVDLSFIQLMGAAMKTAEKGDREFILRPPVPEPVVKGLELSGFLNHTRCVKSGCVWCAVREMVEGA